MNDKNNKFDLDFEKKVARGEYNLLDLERLLVKDKISQELFDDLVDKYFSNTYNKSIEELEEVLSKLRATKDNDKNNELYEEIKQELNYEIQELTNQIDDLEKSIKTSKNLTDNNQPYVNSNLAYSEPNEKIGIYAIVGSIIIVFLLVSLA